jgi:hypothetical protein
MTTIEESEIERINIRRKNEAFRQGAEAGKNIIGYITGRDQPESKKLQEDYPAGKWDGNVFQIPHVEPISSIMMNTRSAMNAPTSAEWSRLVEAFDNGLEPEIVQTFVRVNGEKAYQSLLSILREKSDLRRKQLERTKPTKPSKYPYMSEQALHEFMKNIGFDNLPLSCGHFLHSKTSPQLERLISENALTVLCPLCGKETPRKIVVDWLERKMKSVRS